MTLTDGIVIALIFSGAVYGAFRGLRPALYLLVTFLASLMAVMLLTGPFERLILDVAKVGAGSYPGAPGVAVLILEDQPGAAYAAALIPTFLAAFCLFALGLGGVMLGKFLTDPSKGYASRIFGFLVGSAAGVSASLLFAVQLVRLPWPPAAAMFRGSLIINAIQHWAAFLLPAVAGGA
ncbi:MAG: CvpA family protein [Spirochaetaceae bacterium]|nr:CvpA family protein [Spirochaetaceae bacterium]